MMGIGKDRLVLDTANLAESDNVGAYLRDAAGNLITSTLVSGKQALDVNITNSLSTGVPDQNPFAYGVDTETPIGGVFQDTGATLSAGETGAVRLTAQRAMHMNLRDSSGNELLGQKAMVASIPVVLASDQSSIPVAATQSGAWTTGRTWALSSGADSISAVQSGTWTVQQGTPPWSVIGNIADGSADSTAPVKAGSRANFGSALSAIAASGDRADLLSDRYRRIYTNHAANAGIKTTGATVGVSAAALIATALNGRMNVLVQNLGTKAIFVGDSSVTTANGVRISAGADVTIELGENVSLFAISGTAGQDVRVLEVG